MEQQANLLMVAPAFIQLVDLLLSLPASSADCERGFSLTKVIKSDWRSRLRDTMVTDLMSIQLHSPEIADFDPRPSILRWKESCKRRLSLCSKSSSESDDEIESDDEMIDAFKNSFACGLHVQLYFVVDDVCWNNMLW